jgi:hypothetical protein
MADSLLAPSPGSATPSEANSHSPSAGSTHEERDPWCRGRSCRCQCAGTRRPGLSFGLGGGAVDSHRLVADLNSTGWSAMAVAAKPPVAPRPAGGRLLHPPRPRGGVDGHSRIIGGTANAVFAFPAARRVRTCSPASACTARPRSTGWAPRVRRPVRAQRRGQVRLPGWSKASLFADAVHAILKGGGLPNAGRDHRVHDSGDRRPAVLRPPTTPPTSGRLALREAASSFVPARIG